MSDLIRDPAQPITMPTYDELYAFLKARYKHARFEERNTHPGYEDYTACVTRSSMQALEQYGYDLISHHGSRTGETIMFDRQLQEIPGRPIDGKAH